MTNTTIQTGDMVRYAHPETGEAALRFLVIERRGDRVVLASLDFPEARITPQEVVHINDIVHAE